MATKTNTNVNINENPDMSILLAQILEKMNDNNSIMAAQQSEVLKTMRKVKVLNTMPYDIGFATKVNPYGYVLEGGVIDLQLTFAEIQQLVNDGERIFCGVDGKGAKAPLKIVDFDVYKAVFNLPDATEPEYHLDENAMKKLLSVKDQAEFAKKIESTITTKGEALSLSHYLYAVWGEENAYGWTKRIIDNKLKSFIR